MLPRKMPLIACCISNAPGLLLLLHDLELLALDFLHARLVLCVALLGEGELAEWSVEILHLRESVLDVVASGLVPGFTDCLGDDEDARVRLRGELIGRDALLLHRLLE